jgi:outer membrane receptor protein involved in Fe transport
MVITDTKINQSQETVTQKVRVLYREEFRRQTSYNRNISELMGYQPGQFVNVLSRNDANWGSFGGMGPKYNGYLLDGLPIDSFVDAMSLDPWAFHRIELYEGPASVMYSNYLNMDFAGNESSLAGITNFILKDQVDGPATRIALGSGSFNTYNGRAYHQNRNGNFNYFYGVNFEQSGYADYGTDGTWLTMLDDPDYRKGKLYGKLTYLFDRPDHVLSLFAHHTEHEGDTGRPNKDFDHQYDTVNLIYSNQINTTFNLQAKTGYRYYDRLWGEDNFPTNLALSQHTGVKQNIFPSDLTLNIAHSGNSLLSVGADSQVATYKTYREPVSGPGEFTENDVSAYSTGFFLQEKYVLDKWVLRAGGRFNSTHYSYDLFNGTAPVITDNSWEKALWSAGIRYNLSPQLALYTNSGSSFVVPSAKQLGGTLLTSDAGVPGKNGQLPNPGLTPESGIGSDIGIDLHPTKKMTLGLRGFFNQLDDAIVDNAVSATPSQSRSLNAGNAKSTGIEVAMEYEMMQAIHYFANLTYTTTSLKNELDPDQDGTDIPFVPDYVANVGMTVEMPWRIMASPYMHMVGSYYDNTSKSRRNEFGPYQVLNLKLYKTLIESADYTLHGVIDLNNLTNKRYEMPWQFQDPGFNAFASLEVTF